MADYESPIHVIYGQMQTQLEGDILKAVQSYGINVDKKELLKALQYDRSQYEKGYEAGRASALAEVVRCKDCKYWSQNPYGEDGEMMCKCWADWLPTEANDYCSYGKRREESDAN